MERPEEGSKWKNRHTGREGHVVVREDGLWGLAPLDDNQVYFGTWYREYKDFEVHWERQDKPHHETPAEGSKWRSGDGLVGTVEYHTDGRNWRFRYGPERTSAWSEAGGPAKWWTLIEEAPSHAPDPADSAESAPEPGVGSVDDIAGRIEAALVGLRESAGRAEAAFHDAEVSFRLAAAEVARFEAALRALRGEEGSAPEAPIFAETRDPRQSPESRDTWLDCEGDVVWVVDSEVYHYATINGRRNDDPTNNPLRDAEDRRFVRYLGKMSFSEAQGRSEFRRA